MARARAVGLAVVQAETKLGAALGVLAVLLALREVAERLISTIVVALLFIKVVAVAAAVYSPVAAEQGKQFRLLRLGVEAPAVAVAGLEMVEVLRRAQRAVPAVLLELVLVQAEELLLAVEGGAHLAERRHRQLGMPAVTQLALTGSVLRGRPEIQHEFMEQ
jgi:hypothetical protein